MSQLGKKRRFDRLPFTSGLSPSTDIVGVRRHVANAPRPEVTRRLNTFLQHAIEREAGAN
jgi:hypothetical protein